MSKNVACYEPAEFSGLSQPFPPLLGEISSIPVYQPLESHLWEGLPYAEGATLRQAIRAATSKAKYIIISDVGVTSTTFWLYLPDAVTWTPGGPSLQIAADSVRLNDYTSISVSAPALAADSSAEFLEQVYALAATRPSRAIDLVIDHIDNLLNGGRPGLAACNDLLLQVDLARLPSSVRRAFLAVTRPAKSHLRGREAFYRDAVAALGTERSPEIAAKMLASLA